MLKEEIRKTAEEMHLKYGSCSQCVLASLKEHGIEISDEVIKASHIFAGGTAGCGEGFCGALNGGLTAISCFNGRERNEFGISDAKENKKLGKRLIKKFLKEYNGLFSCSEIQTSFVGISFNHMDNEKVKVNSQHKDKKKACKKSCAELTGKVAEWTYEILDENESF
ncbi:MAG: hypothetical protein CSB55_08840 [Candidatus Cloacimonadota bacterium]|nr:MAG: hypothetical protein CSB55_08840 [Candidatus Cloacimonadota bacterium]